MDKILTGIYVVAGIAFVLCAIFLVYVVRSTKKNTNAQPGMTPSKMTTNTSRTNAKGESGKNETKTSTAQEFLPFDDIIGPYIKVEGVYRAVIECSSINYDLLSDTERDVLEDTFRQMIDSMDYVFAFHIQTREVDPRELLMIAADDVENIRVNMPLAYNYAKEYYRNFQQFNNQSVIVKKKYIIVSSDIITSTTLNEEDKMKIATDQVNNRVTSVIAQLRNMKIQGAMLDHGQLLELMKMAIEKKTGGAIDGLTSGDFMSEYVEGRDTSSVLSNCYAKADNVMEQFENRIDLELCRDPEIDDERREYMYHLLKDVQYLRDKYAGYFKDRQGHPDYYKDSTFVDDAWNKKERNGYLNDNNSNRNRPADNDRSAKINKAKTESISESQVSLTKPGKDESYIAPEEAEIRPVKRNKNVIIDTAPEKDIPLTDSPVKVQGEIVGSASEPSFDDNDMEFDVGEDISFTPSKKAETIANPFEDIVFNPVSTNDNIKNTNTRRKNANDEFEL